MVPHPLTSLGVDRVSTVVVPLACSDGVTTLLNIGRSDELLLVWRPALLLSLSSEPRALEPGRATGRLGKFETALYNDR
jgi:hypothetical protein